GLLRNRLARGALTNLCNMKNTVFLIRYSSGGTIFLCEASLTQNASTEEHTKNVAVGSSQSRCARARGALPEPHRACSRQLCSRNWDRRGAHWRRLAGFSCFAESRRADG